MAIRPAAALWLAALWLAAHGASCAGAPSGGAARLDPVLLAPHELWFGVYLDGNKVGHAFTRCGIDSLGGVRVVARRSGLEFRAVSDGEPIETITDNAELYSAEPPYELLRMTSRLTRRGVTATTDVFREGTGLRIAIEREGTHETRHVKSLEYGLRDVLADAIWLRYPPQVGASHRVRHFDLDTLAIGTLTTTLRATRSGLLDGVAVTWHEVERRRTTDDTVELERFDADGRSLSWQLGTFVMQREPREVATRRDTSVDLAVLGSAPIDRPLGASTRVELLASGAGIDALRNAPGQRVEPVDAEVVRVTLEPAAGPVATADAVARALQASLRFPADDAGLRALAEAAVAGAREPRERIARLVGFVAEFVADSTTLADHPTVHDVVRTRSGDCSDHTLLFTTLARAAGIPARPAVGLVYLGDETCAFGPHEWCEVVLDGRWTAVDPTWNEVPASPLRLRLGADAAAAPWSARLRLELVDAH